MVENYDKFNDAGLLLLVVVVGFFLFVGFIGAITSRYK